MNFNFTVESYDKQRALIVINGVKAEYDITNGISDTYYDAMITDDLSALMIDYALESLAELMNEL